MNLTQPKTKATSTSMACRWQMPNFEWETAVVREDTRKQYAEQRLDAIGLIGDRLHVMVYCLRGDAVRVISLRKANLREVKRYVEN
jgi:uncharacterized DUF497 family protein